MIDITTSLEWSKKLRDAGWDQTIGSFRWFDGRECGLHRGNEIHVRDKIKEDEEPFVGFGTARGSCEIAAAPTAEEVLRELPVLMRRRMKGIRRRKTQNYDFILQIQPRTDGTFKIQYRSNEYGNASSAINSLLPFSSTEKLLANASASMWIYLKENDLLPPKE